MNSITDICSAVKKIAWGYLLMFLDFNIMTVDILPDWVGFVLIVSALSYIVFDEDDLNKLRSVGIILIIWNIVEWVANIFSIGIYLSYVGIIPMIMNLYLIWHLFGNLADIAENYSCPQEGKLRGWRILYMIFTVISSAVSYIALLSGEGEVVTLGSLVLLPFMLILMIFILVVLFSFSNSLGEFENTYVVGIQPLPPDIQIPPPTVENISVYNNENKYQ